MARRIIAGLDGSPRQSHVVAAAVEFAQSRAAELHLCRAMQVPLSIPAVVWSLQGHEFEDFLIKHAEEELTKLEGIPPELVAGRHCRVGQPADVLCTLASELGAECVVIGTHGFDRADWLLGTTAAKVVNRAPCSVLVVR